MSCAKGKEREELMAHTNKTFLELPGIDPGTSHMLSERSTT